MKRSDVAGRGLGRPRLAWPAATNLRSEQVETAPPPMEAPVAPAADRAGRSGRRTPLPRPTPRRPTRPCRPSSVRPKRRSSPRAKPCSTDRTPQGCPDSLIAGGASGEPGPTRTSLADQGSNIDVEVRSFRQIALRVRRGGPWLERVGPGGRRPRPIRAAQIRGDLDAELRAALVRAIGETDGPPANRFEARRRARAAVESAEALLRSEGYYQPTLEDVVEGEDNPGRHRRHHARPPLRPGRRRSSSGSRPSRRPRSIRTAQAEIGLEARRSGPRRRRHRRRGPDHRRPDARGLSPTP